MFVFQSQFSIWPVCVNASHMFLSAFWPMSDKFTWTQEYRRTWEEDHQERLQHVFMKNNTLESGRKGLIRHTLFIIDTSSSIEKPEFIPTVRHHITHLIPKFIDRFKLLNPLSILSFISCQDMLIRYTKHFDPKLLLNTVGAGSFSFLNSLHSAISILKRSKYFRECVLITASIGTKDMLDPGSVLADLLKYHIKLNIISICGEIKLFKHFAESTAGKLIVPLNLSHFEIQLDEFTRPVQLASKTTSLVRLGFPNKIEMPSLCICHLDFHVELWECPNCHSLSCSIPVQCYICELQLVSAVDLAKTSHFIYSSKYLSPATGICTSCAKNAVASCDECGTLYCSDCCDIVSNSLLFCPFCTTNTT